MVDPSVVDWQPFLSQTVLGQNNKLKILEFGLGSGTDLFLDMGHTVHSIEILPSSKDASWFETVKSKNKSRAWTGEIIYLPPDLDAIETFQRSKAIYNAEQSKLIVNRLRDVLKSHIEGKGYDFIFVDPGIHLRGELVNLSFEYNPRFVAAHDTNISPNHYGWNFISPPPNYLTLKYGEGIGTTLMGTWLFIRTA